MKPACGLLAGKVTLYFFVDKDDKLQYDDIEKDYSDSYVNNQYEGTWSSHKSKSTKTANWGEYRIPNSRELDVGAAEFHPKKEFIKNGWDDYK